jgi:hypothetical protein
LWKTITHGAASAFLGKNTSNERCKKDNFLEVFIFHSCEPIYSHRNNEQDETPEREHEITDPHAASATIPRKNHAENLRRGYQNKAQPILNYQKDNCPRNNTVHGESLLRAKYTALQIQ